MNEVTKIHLGRQAYTISVDAHHALKMYIAAISKQVKEDDVISEIEVRMSELLTERGINSNKVILMSDVDYLKSQLGTPADFVDEASQETSELPSETKRLFRDTDRGIIAGVAAGLSEYFGLDALLIRIVFVILVLVTAGWGILLYILLWLLVPEAKSPSERLQMAGRPITVQNLKEVVGQADVKGAARRANGALAGPINGVFNVALKIVGILFVASGLTALLGLIAGETYFLVRTHAWLHNNIFPVGWRENLLLHISVAVSALAALFIVLFGIAIYRRKWPIKTWITGVLAGLTLIGLAVGVALTADVYPDVHSAYLANTHTTVRSLPAFTNMQLNGDVGNLNFVPSSKYMVALNYYDHPNTSTIKTSVTKGTLLIDTSNFNWHRNCSTLCFPKDYRLNITIYAPNALQLENQSIPTPPMVTITPMQVKIGK